MEILRIGSSDGVGLRRWFEVVDAVEKHDSPDAPPPSARVWTGRPRTPWPGCEERVYLAIDGPRAVGAARLKLFHHENRDVACAWGWVLPGSRRLGVGRTLLRYLSDESHRAGRTRIVIENPEPGPGHAFLAALGFRRVTRERRWRLDLPAGQDLRTRYAPLLGEVRARARGYSLVSWVDATPERYVRDFARAFGRMSTDVPHDALAWGEAGYDVQRVRDLEGVLDALGLRRYTTAAVDAGDTLVGYTCLAQPTDIPPGTAEQWDTFVLPEHRGRRLGLLLKIENLLWARQREPRLTMVHTSNADANEAMVRVNRMIEFTPDVPWSKWEREVTGGR
ncbi:GNAT family N-acetyltransferase [Streptomyces xanthophaeus]|uniref:GNAT family N-acetyltransferase n=1 Tax=Streptomyces xanthophaeus TaxID=67385 RepID=UPI00399014AC